MQILRRSKIIRLNSKYYNNLINKIIDNSETATWQDAVLEWAVVDCEEDEELLSSCVCGKENLRYLFTIRNVYNRNILYPIGSSCIKKFERNELNYDVSIREQLFKLLHAIENNNYISLSSEFFSRKLIKFLYDSGAFKATIYNNQRPINDYKFLLNMFNKRDKDSISSAQNKKINAIILSSVNPFLMNMLQSKIKKKGTS